MLFVVEQMFVQETPSSTSETLILQDIDKKIIKIKYFVMILSLQNSNSPVLLDDGSIQKL